METSREIDESLYSRQMYVLGLDAMTRMAQSRVLISGLSGLGAEIAKNVILGGVHSVTLHDTKSCALSDLSTQFCLSEIDIGRNRAEASLKFLQGLNSFVKVSEHKEDLSTEFLSNFDVVVLANASLKEQLRVSEIVRGNDKTLIIADSRGLFPQIFCDFGPSFVVVDKDGREELTAPISFVSREPKGLVTCVEDHNFRYGDWVKFSGVEGMTELNNLPAVPIQMVSLNQFTIGDTSSYSEYKKNGMAYLVKMPFTVNFTCFPDSLKSPRFSENGLTMGRTQQLHLAYMTFHSYVTKYGRAPKPWDNNDAETFAELCENINENLEGSAKVSSVDKEFQHIFSYTCSGSFSPVTSVTGAIVAQEVFKACSGKFHPIFQWLYLDFSGILPARPISDCGSVESRYDSQRAILGNGFQKTLSELRYFLVGAGAIGCELLKNFAMMGVACGGGNNGSIVITDMDSIEKSNLNRQFLFRPADCGKLKSETAAEAIKRMNPNMSITCYALEVGPGTEDVFNESFFESLDAVCLALDNAEARLYMDSRCVLFQRPMVESGTMGTHGSVSVAIPNLTNSYGSNPPGKSKSIPLCTLKQFPYKLEYTIQWGRELFQEHFYNEAKHAMDFLQNPAYVSEVLNQPALERLDILRCIKSALADHKVSSIQDCVGWALSLWHKLFVNEISQLVSLYPENSLTPEGLPFWGGSKRFPTPLNFDHTNDVHMDFVFAAANLKAENYGVPQCRNRELMTEVVRTIQQSNPRPSSAQALDEETESTLLEKAVASIDRTQKLHIRPTVFEKDDDTNLHMDFIAAASNLRSSNYSIPTVDRQNIKKIAGNIIPAIATTTSLVAGLACLELCKIALGHKDIKQYKMSFINLALPRFTIVSPSSAIKTNYRDHEWTIWNFFEVQGSVTVGKLLEKFQDEYGLQISGIFKDQSMVYSNLLFDDNELQEIRDLPLRVAVEKSVETGLPSQSRFVVLGLQCCDENGEEITVPQMKCFV